MARSHFQDRKRHGCFEFVFWKNNQCTKQANGNSRYKLLVDILIRKEIHFEFIASTAAHAKKRAWQNNYLRFKPKAVRKTDLLQCRLSFLKALLAFSSKKEMDFLSPFDAGGRKRSIYSRTYVPK